MKRWKNLLLPLLTVLAVIGAAFIPQQISLLRDASLFDSVHTQALTDGSDFALWTPSLLERIDLISRFRDGDENVTYILQNLYADSLASTELQALEQLTKLCEADVIWKDAMPNAISLSSASRVDLWTPGALVGASFRIVHLEDTGLGWGMDATLDEESGKIIVLFLYTSLQGDYHWPEDMGERFLNWLGVDHELSQAGYNYALFTLEGDTVSYLVYSDSTYLSLVPQPGVLLAYGTELSPSYAEAGSNRNRLENDASLIQKRGQFDAGKR